MLFKKTVFRVHTRPPLTENLYELVYGLCDEDGDLSDPVEDVIGQIRP
jgi:hypothetical protein